jgi:indolepyruvate ferredoxin oxidoreductase beta subunit
MTQIDNDNTKSILLAGVGGQGILRASDILCQILIESGFDTKKSEVHGMAQRGGCVTSHVRYGKKVFSPIAKKGSVDLLLSFEKLETLRYLEYLKPNATLIINEVEIYPPSVNLGESDYPGNIVDIVKNNFSAVKLINAKDIALKAGNFRAENVALLGVLSQYLQIENSVWERVLSSAFPEKLVKSNLTAFELGKAA